MTISAFEDVRLSERQSAILSTLDEITIHEAKDCYSVLDRLSIFKANTPPLKKFLLEQIEEKKCELLGNNLTDHAFYLNEWQFKYTDGDQKASLTSCLDFVGTLKNTALEDGRYKEACQYNEWHYERYASMPHFSEKQKDDQFAACFRFHETVVDTALDTNKHVEALVLSQGTPHNPFQFWKGKTTDQCVGFLTKLQKAAVASTDHANAALYALLLKEAQELTQDKGGEQLNAEQLSEKVDQSWARKKTAFENLALVCAH